MPLTYAVGDIHGRLTKLRNLLNLCEEDANGRPMKFIFLGDYIDRGPGSKGVIEQLMALQQAQPEHVICLMGNHEDMLLTAIDHPDWQDRWLHNGGVQTLKNYGVTDATRIPTSHIDWLRQLLKFHDDGLRFFVHAGIHPDRTLNQQDDFDLLWIREPFLSSSRDFSRLIVHGHTPSRDGRPDIRINRLNIDTGAVFGGSLTAAVFDQTRRHPLRFLASR